MDVSSGGHWTRARGIRQDAGKSREGKGFSQGFYFNEKGSNEKINEFHQQNYHKIDVVTTWGKNSHPGIIQFEQIFSAKLGALLQCCKFPRPPFWQEPSVKKTGAILRALCRPSGGSVERPTSAPKGRPKAVSPWSPRAAQAATQMLRGGPTGRDGMEGLGNKEKPT